MELLTQLAENGLLALLLAISIVGGVYLFLRLQASQTANDILQEKRLADYREMLDKYVLFVDSMKGTLNSTVEALKGKKR